MNRNHNQNWLNKTQNNKTFELRILDCMLHRCKHYIINEIITVTCITLNMHLRIKFVLEIIGHEAYFTLKHSTTMYITQNRWIKKHCETLQPWVVCALVGSTMGTMVVRPPGYGRAPTRLAIDRSWPLQTSAGGQGEN